MMDPAELTAVREDLGFSSVELAAELGIAIQQVAAWEAGTLPVPRRMAVDLRYRAAVARVEREMEAAGLSQCPWFTEWQNGLKANPKKLDKQIKRLMEHGRGCERCQARDEFVEQHGALPEAPPLPGLLGIGDGFVKWTQRFPEWLRPAVQAGVAFGAMTLLRNVFSIPAIFDHPRIAVTLLEATLGATFGAGYLGLVGSFIYRWMRRTAADASVMLSLAAGIAGAVALVLASVVPMLCLVDADWLLHGGSWKTMLIGAVPCGVLFGVWLRREQKASVTGLAS